MKRGPSTFSHRDSQPFCPEVDEASPDNVSSPPIAPATRTQKYVTDNEITVQSELNEDHPSTGSYLTDARYQNEESKISDYSSGIRPLPSINSMSGSNIATSTPGPSISAKLNGNFIPHDRHLLVSPALSPAPSICYSPSPASSAISNHMTLDLAELDEAFKGITFGFSDGHAQNVKSPPRQQQSESTYYTQHPIQSREDLINDITVILASAGTNRNSEGQSSGGRFDIEPLANHIETHLKTYCDEHFFNLKFLNLSHEHLMQHFHINNILDVTMRILEHEYQRNGQRLIVIVVADTATNELLSSDKRQLPTKIDAQIMTKFLAMEQVEISEKVKNIIRRWYHQVANTFYLKPIHLVYSDISGETKDLREKAWSDWLNDAGEIMKVLDIIPDNVSRGLSENQTEQFAFRPSSIFDATIEFILKESNLLKRTLLVRNSTSSNSSNVTSSQANQRLATINELARLLSDSNKMTLKRSMNNEEFLRSVGDWIHDNFSKFFENIIDNQVTQGKHIPHYIERNLFAELTCQRIHLERYLNETTENFEAKCLSFYESQISPILNGLSGITDDTACYSSSDLTNDQQLSQAPSHHLVFLSGPGGCGKSTLFAQIIKLAVQNFGQKAHMIYRFCGISLDSLSPNRILRSICEQFCQTQGENVIAASYIYSARAEVMKALNKIIKLRTTLIFLDGLDECDSLGRSLDWLCEIEASSNVRVFITLRTDSDLYKKGLSAYTDATHISFDGPSVNEWAQMLTVMAKSNQYICSGNICEEIKCLGAAGFEEGSINYTSIAEIMAISRSRKLNNEFIYPELSFDNPNSILKMSQVNRSFLINLQYLLSPYQLCAFIIILDSSRNGLYEQDIINVMTMISKSSKAQANIETKFSTTLLNYLVIQLGPKLQHIICDKSVKLSINKQFAKAAIDHYSKSKYPNIVMDIRDFLLEYFSRQTKSKLSRSGLMKLDLDRNDTRDNVDPSEHLWLASQSSEVVNLLILTNKSKAKEHIMSRGNFFSQFLYGSMPEEFIEDCDRLKESDGKKSSINEDLQTLVNFIKQSIHPLRYDGRQIYSQIYCRAYDMIKTGKSSKSKKLNDILNTASCPPMRSLLPIGEASVNSFIKSRIGQPQGSTQALSNSVSAGATGKLSASSQPSGPNRTQSKQKIFTIKDNHRHLVVIYPDKGCLSVWDIYDEKAVRTINNMDNPRDLRMIDQKRAVILCNRELRVYDLDSGQLLSKLKGVMNQKMPFFEVFGDNYVIALARNRMCVNMLNLNSGELETTFKVGEDRFLNSLLVSADGGICVCGDETQKPFPLLVWNLNERRLMYDLRLERHEFVTRMSALSDDGHFAVSVCRQVGDGDSSNGSPADSFHKSPPNFIVIYDLSSGTLFKKWKPGLDTCAVAISYTPGKSGKVINTIVDCNILVWDLVTGSKRHTLMGHSAVADVIKVQNNRLFSMDSTCRDQSLRIWDIEEGQCLAVFSPDAPVACSQISIRGDALVCGFSSETRLSTLVVCKNETVNDIIKKNKRRKSSKSLYIFDEPPSRKMSS